MRELDDVGVRRFTTVVALDEPGLGNRACHAYRVHNVSDLQIVYADITFQNGPIKESGVNGCQNEDLLAIVIDRLRGFQSGEFACEDNAYALAHLEDALSLLNHRTQSRIIRGVEGTSKI